MRTILQYIAWGVGLWLNLRVISVMLRGFYRQYPLAFAYAVSLLLATIVEIAAATAPSALDWRPYYWADEVGLDILVFCVVIGFIGQAAPAAKRPVARRWLIAMAALIVAASFLLHTDPRRNWRMTLVSRDLNLCAMTLDLILWSLLVASRKPDRRLLLLSGGLGIQLTGAILGASVCGLAHNHALLFLGTALEVITGFIALYVWWRAFRALPAPATYAVKTAKGGPPA